MAPGVVSSTRIRQQQQEVGHVGVDEGVQPLLGPRHRVVLDAGAGQRELDLAAVRPLQRAAVERPQERGHIGRLQICDVQIHSLFGVDVDALPHRLLAPVRVPAVHGGEVADPGHRVVQNLLAEVPGQVAAAGLYGMRRAEVGAGRHRHQVGRLVHEETGGVRARARRIDEGDHRHPGIEQRRDDRVHRLGIAARRVGDQQQRGRSLARGPGHCLLEIAGGDSVDLAIEVSLEHRR